MRNYMLCLILICGLQIHPFNAFCDESESTIPWTKEKKVFMANLSGLTAVTIWGVANWDYFDRSPSMANEGWFSSRTDEGGADKLGHFYTSYLISRLLSTTFRDWGYSKEKGALLAAFSTFGIMGWMEFGDSFSEYGFSYEDFIMNTVGSAAAYLLETRPELAEKIDFRVEYTPNFDDLDFFTDYEHLKYLTALKFNGFNWGRKKGLEYLELHLGYYARGFSDHHGDRKRNLYFGIGVNLSKLLDQLSFKKTAEFTRLFQIPFTSIRLEKDF